MTRSTKPRQLSLRRVLNTATLVLLVKKSTTAVVSLIVRYVMVPSSAIKTSWLLVVETLLLKKEFIWHALPIAWPLFTVVTNCVLKRSFKPVPSPMKRSSLSGIPSLKKSRVMTSRFAVLISRMSKLVRWLTTNLAVSLFMSDLILFQITWQASTSLTKMVG